MKGVLTMKGSGCVRVTASGACARLAPSKAIREPGKRCFRSAAVPRRSWRRFQTDDVFNEHGIAATQSSAKASGDKDDLDRARAALLAEGRAMSSRRIGSI
jgi:hypothetical protein